MNNDQVILVDENDKELGLMEKMEAHQRGFLHRAFSIFIFNPANEMLLQQRALNKYHSSGLWSNTCCSHPGPGEDIGEAALRRLNEEMGFTTPLKKIFDFVYTASFENGLKENEFDHVFAGRYDGKIEVNHHEVKDWSFRPMEQIRQDLKERPLQYTPWFRIAFPTIDNWLDKHSDQYWLLSSPL